MGSRTEAKIDVNRLERFRASGLDLTRAMEFSADRSVDLHLFERLLREGCTVATAAEIVAPAG